jgi:glycosyltransferase involved in cell wall biosynthesis
MRGRSIFFHNRAMTPPAVSVLIPILNMKRYLPETVASVYAQTCPDWEMVLIDDGSADGSVELAQEYAGRDAQRVRVLSSDATMAHGASAARNRGLRAARGEWIAFLDADDLWLPDKLERQIDIVRRHPPAVMTFARVLYFHDDPALAPERDQPFGALHEGMYSPPALAREFLLDADVYPCPSATLIRADALRAVGGFEERFRKVRTDLAVWVKLGSRFPIYADPSVLVRYRQHAESSVAQLFGDESLYNTNELLLAEWLAEYIETLPPEQRKPLEDTVCARLFRSQLVLLKAQRIRNWRAGMLRALWKYPVYRRGGRILWALLPSGLRQRKM